MDLRKYQGIVRGGLSIDSGVDPLSHCGLGLAGEAGEVADLIKKSQYKESQGVNVTRLMEECGDVLWYLTAIADQHGFSLDELATMNIEKLAQRRVYYQPFSELRR